MANLENISIQINANTSSASSGISSLVTSLHSLTSALNSAASAANTLIKALQKLKKAGGSTGLDGITTGIMGGAGTGKGSGTGKTTPMSTGMSISSSTTSSLGKAAGGLKSVADEADKARDKVGGLSKAFSQFSRIGRMMIMRTAIRSLFKAFSQAWQSAYKFSQAVGGTFAKNIDTIKGSIQGAAINLIRAFAPALQVVAPIINVVANAIKYLCDMIIKLLSLIGISSEMFGATTDKINEYGSASGKASKGVLAAFDELNVIGQKGGGGGGGGAASTKGLFSDKITDEMAKIQAIVGTSMIALGLILAFSGHIPLGVGMIAIGAAAIVKTVVNDWGKLTQKTKNEVATIMAIAAGASLALGLILALTGHVGLGIGLIALGVANMVAVTAVKDSLTPELKQKIDTITKFVSIASLALGAILLFTGNIPLGLALIAAGATGLAAATSPDWNTFVDKVKSVFGKVTDFLTGAWNTIKKTAVEAWNAVTVWWETSGVGQWVRNTWSSVKQWFSDTWTSVSKWATQAWRDVSQWWETRIAPKIEAEGAWGGVKAIFGELWGAVKGVANDAWNSVKKWWEESGLGERVRNAWAQTTEALTNVWNTVKTAVSDAWLSVTRWWEESGVGPAVRVAWEGTKRFLVTVWGDIKTVISGAWEIAKKWWETSGLGEKVRKIWKDFKDNMLAMVQPVVDIFEKVWGFIQKIFGIGKATVSIDTTLTKNYKTISGGSSVSPSANNTRMEKASGAYGIPKGDVFVANEAGAELVGSINGKTSVANQQQIIEGISRGVATANAEQNALLKEQNALLRSILAKDNTVKIGASAALGRTASQSIQMYNQMVGG